MQHRRESGLRRHMAKHAAVPQDSPISEPAASEDGLDTAATIFAMPGAENDYTIAEKKVTFRPRRVPRPAMPSSWTIDHHALG